MREIVNIQVGYSGNKIGTKFWRQISREHRLDLTGVHHGDDSRQLERIEVYYDQSKDGYYSPRSILVDSHPRGLCEEIIQGVSFPKKNIVMGKNGTGGSYAKGSMEYGPDLANDVLEKVRQCLEMCERPQGFQICHGIGGGTGSGVGMRVVSKIREEFPELLVMCSSIFPSSKMHNSVVHPYNTVLSMNDLTWNCDGVSTYDYGAIYDICERGMKTSNATYEQLAEICAETMACLTTSLRYNGDVYDNLNKMLINLIPFPKLHFFAPGFDPISFKSCPILKSPTTAQLIENVFSPKTCLAGCNPIQGKIISAMTVFRGRNSLREIDESLSDKFKEINFLDWIRDSVNNVICDVKVGDLARSLATLTNSSAVADMFQTISSDFDKLWRRKTSLISYIGDTGMDEMEFSEAFCSLQDLISEHMCTAEYCPDEDDDEDETSDEFSDED